MEDPTRHNTLAGGAAAAAITAAPRVFAQRRAREELSSSTKKAPFASTMKRPGPVSRWCRFPLVVPR